MKPVGNYQPTGSSQLNNWKHPFMILIFCLLKIEIINRK
nr:MAG TPA: hypothetical protein [Caudoviricetes sp.]